MATSTATALLVDPLKIDPFTSSAQRYARVGIVTLPTGLDKKPAVRAWGTFLPGTASKLVDQGRHRGMNIAMACGAKSRITVIDIDSNRPEVLAEMLERFGPTPVRVRTPKGGWHLWYRHNGEGCGRRILGKGKDDHHVDLRGSGGIAVLPPSRTEHGIYEFELGDETLIGQLPTMRPGSLPMPSPPRGRSRQAGAKIPEGTRNDWLFGRLLREVRHCGSLEDLIDVGETLNDDEVEEPLPHAEVQAICNSVWRITENGDNWVGRGAHVTVSMPDFMGLAAAGRDAFTLFAFLRLSHAGGKGKIISISPKAMVESKCIPGWLTPRRYQNARDQLEAAGYLRKVHHGGAGLGDSSKYRMATPAPLGAVAAPNITVTPPPPGKGAKVLAFRNLP